jgi:cytoskeleton protein RodZ
MLFSSYRLNSNAAIHNQKSWQLLSEERLMSETALPIGFADTAQSVLDASKTAGQLLQEAREAQGLHVAALAVSLKVPVKKLEALEADRLEELADTVFVRALASSMCRALKTDPKPILAKLPQLNSHVFNQAEGGVNVTFRTRADGPAPSALASISRPLMAAVLAILLAALAVMLWPDFAARSAADSGSNAGSAALSAQATGAGVSMGNPINVPSIPAGTLSDAGTKIVSAAAPVFVVAAVPGNLAASVTPTLSNPSVSSPTLTLTPLLVDASTLTPQLPGALQVLPDSVVVFAATGESWVEVKDASGRIILQRTLKNGEKVGAGPSQGKLPYKVTIGQANFTQVAVRGQTLDLAPLSSKDAVARFSVK